MRRIDTPLLNKIKEQNQTLYNSNDPRMSIQVSRAKTTVMDSTYWTVETIRTKAGLGDLSIAARRLKPYGRPDKLYNIYVDNGIVKTATREYPDYEEEKWQDQFSLGSGTAVAICLDGYWELYRGKWQQVTSEKPWLFWVNSGRLYTQYWDETDTRLELATGVSKLKAIRGWANVNIMIQDQGVIVGYIKTDGKVYYRNYCRQANGSYLWENETQITQFTGTANTLNLFITNDYRTGFAVEDSTGKIHLYITTRDWAGMGIEAHTIRARAEALIDFLPITYYSACEYERITAKADALADLLFARQDNSITRVENVPIIRINEEGVEYQDWGFAVRVRFNYEIIGTPVITLTDPVIQSTFSVLRIDEIEPGYEYLVLVDDGVHEFGFNAAEADLDVVVSSFTNEAGYNYEVIDNVFTPINLVPPLIPLPEVEAIWNE